MYSWSDDTTDWYGAGSYSYDDRSKAARRRPNRRPARRRACPRR